MMFASGVLAKAPSSDKASPSFCSSFKYSGKFAIILPASEISLFSTSILAVAANDLIIGSNENVANIGASSVIV